jgi:O-antigen/teichoic acid export membrane protein
VSVAGAPDGAPPAPPAAVSRPGLARATMLAVQADVATAVSGFAVAIVVARGLGPANRGIYFLALLVATMIALLGNLGLVTSAIVYGSSRRVSLGELHGTAIAFSLAIGGLGAALLLGLEQVWVTSVLRGMDHATLILVALGIGPLVYGQIVGALLTGMGHVPTISAMRIALAVGTPVLTIPAVVLGGGRPVWPVGAWLAATVAFGGVLGIYTARLAAPRLPKATTLRELVSFSLRGHVGTLAHQGFLRLDVLFVSARLGPTSVGLYSQASVLAERMSTLGHALYSSSAVHFGSEPLAAASELAASLMRMLLVVTVPVATVLGLLAHPIMTVLFGSDFGPAAVPFAILLPGTVCLTLWYVLGLFIMSALHRPGTTTLIQGAGLIVAAPLYWLAVHHWGMSGAAVVSTLVYVGVFGGGVVVLIRTPWVSLAQLCPRVDDVRRVAGLLQVAVKSVRRRAATPH